MAQEKLESKTPGNGTLLVRVVAGVERTVVTDATVRSSQGKISQTKRTDQNGIAVFRKLSVGEYTIECRHQAETGINTIGVLVSANGFAEAEIHLVPNLRVELNYFDRNVTPTTQELLQINDRIDLEISGWPLAPDLVTPPPKFHLVKNDSNAPDATTAPIIFTDSVRKGGRQDLDLTFSFPPLDINTATAWTQIRNSVIASDMPSTPIRGHVDATLSRTATEPTDDVALWVAIRNSTEALSFNNYLRFMDWIFCGKDDRSSLKTFEQN